MSGCANRAYKIGPSTTFEKKRSFCWKFENSTIVGLTKGILLCGTDIRCDIVWYRHILMDGWAINFYFADGHTRSSGLGHSLRPRSVRLMLILLTQACDFSSAWNAVRLIRVGTGVQSRIHQHTNSDHVASCKIRQNVAFVRGYQNNGNGGVRGCFVASEELNVRDESDQGVLRVLYQTKKHMTPQIIQYGNMLFAPELNLVWV